VIARWYGQLLYYLLFFCAKRLFPCVAVNEDATGEHVAAVVMAVDEATLDLYLTRHDYKEAVRDH
jgi:hypothetical protein